MIGGIRVSVRCLRQVNPLPALQPTLTVDAVMRPLHRSRKDGTMSNIRLLAPANRTHASLRPRNLFLLEMLLALLAGIVVSVAGAGDGELLLRLLSGWPWMR
jgi:hypothetical protein